MGPTQLLRAGAAFTARALHLSAEAFELLAGWTEDVAGLKRDRPTNVASVAATPQDEPRVSAVEPTDETQAPTETPAPTDEIPASERPVIPQAGVPPAKRHVDEEAVLVSESADLGAENGAGAQLHVSEPWEGYRSMHAADIVDRLVVESEEALSVVLLYEQLGRNRSTVLTAAKRELARRRV